MTRLSVNLNKVALLRNTRALGIPSVVHAATIALESGADGITVHPRPDRRHIRPDDVYDLAKLLKNRERVEFNIEGNPFHGILDLVRGVRPQQCTLVPDEESALTSDHGWDLEHNAESLMPIIAEIKSLGARVSLFMDPKHEMMRTAREVGADRVELYTEPYARAFGTPEENRVLAHYRVAAEAAQQAGLGVNAGHDLNRANLPHFLQTVRGVLEVSIGHALIADALEFGLAQTVREYLAVIGRDASGDMS